MAALVRVLVDQSCRVLVDCRLEGTCIKACRQRHLVFALAALGARGRRLAKGPRTAPAAHGQAPCGRPRRLLRLGRRCTWRGAAAGRHSRRSSLATAGGRRWRGRRRRLGRLADGSIGRRRSRRRARDARPLGRGRRALSRTVGASTQPLELILRLSADGIELRGTERPKAERVSFERGPVTRGLLKGLVEPRPSELQLAACASRGVGLRLARALFSRATEAKLGLDPRRVALEPILPCDAWCGDRRCSLALAQEPLHKCDALHSSLLPRTVLVCCCCRRRIWSRCVRGHLRRAALFALAAQRREDALTLGMGDVFRHVIAAGDRRLSRRVANTTRRIPSRACANDMSTVGQMMCRKRRIRRDLT